MELIQLKYFKTVASVGKLSDAAQSLFVSAPALSTSISRLEKELGVSLFDRTKNRITLNQQGHIFLKYVNQVFTSLECAKTELRQSVSLQGMHVSIAFLISTQWVSMLTAFSQENPNFTLSCTTIPQDKLLQNGIPMQYNFLLAPENKVPVQLLDDLDSIALFEDHPVVMVHPDHPLAQKRAVDITALKGENIFLPMKVYSMYELLVELFESNGIPFPEDNAYSHLVAQELVAKGLGVGFTTKNMMPRTTAPVNCVPISNNYKPWVTRLYWRKQTPLTPEQVFFKDFVQQYYAPKSDS